MVKNLVAFSTAAGDVWDIYVQNLRNYVGAYLVYNTNITTFYTNSNVTEVFQSFSAPARNLMENSSCGFIYDGVGKMYGEVVRSVDYLLMPVVFCFSIGIMGCVLMFGVWEVEKRVMGGGRVKNLDVESEENVRKDLDRTKDKRKRWNMDDSLGI